MSSKGVVVEDSGKSPGKSTLYIRQLGLHHFAYLRAVADGIAVEVAAKRYLAVEHASAAVTAHRRVVDHLRGVARRGGMRDWRLVGLVIRASAEAEKPTLDAWAADRGLDDGWSEAELQEMYAEAFPADRREERNARMRRRQLELLKSLQAAAAKAPQPSDPVSGWFDEATAERLKRGGILLLSELQAVIARGGRWWAPLNAIGEGKARRIEAYLSTIGLAAGAAPPAAAPAAPAFSLANTVQATDGASPALPSSSLPARLPVLSAPPAERTPANGLLDGSAGLNRAVAVYAVTPANNDLEAIKQWIAARAGSEATRTAYHRESERLLLWSIRERGKGLSSLTTEDCLAYMAFLEHIPDAWISRRRAGRYEDGWAPFAKQLSHASRKQAIVVVASLFAWLVSAHYLQANPWALINRKTGDDAEQNLLDSRAFTKDAWQSVQGYVRNAPPSPSRSRIIFLMEFGEATGLRASEFVSARVGDFQIHRGRWALRVHGKGSKNRIVAITTQALNAVDAYLAERQLPGLGSSELDKSIPLVASSTDSSAPVSYGRLYKSSKAWFVKSIRASALPVSEQFQALRASVHWLRHTCGTRALERGAPLQIVQGQLGHSDPRTTMKYSKSQLEERMAGMDAVFGKA